MIDPEPPVSDDGDQAKNSLMRRRTTESPINTSVDTPSVPPIVHTVLNSGGGQPLDSATRAFMEPRFSHDFSQVQVHADPKAVESARAINAIAYTIGQNVVFGTGQYQPQTEAGRELLAHELTHVVQQQTTISPILQRQSPHRSQPKPFRVPHDLLESPDLNRFTDQQLHQRYDRIAEVLRKHRKDINAQNIKHLETEVGRIGTTLTQRTIFTFDPKAIEQMRQHFINAVQEEKEHEEQGREHLACINVFREGIAKLYGSEKHLGMTKHNTIEEVMANLQAAQMAGPVKEIYFLGGKKKHPIGKGSGLRPDDLASSVWDAVIKMTDNIFGWSVLALSLLDGFHSVVLAVDNRHPPKPPTIYWADQTTWHGPGFEPFKKAASGHVREFEAGDRRGLDEYILYFTQVNWEQDDPQKRPWPIVRLWRLRHPSPPPAQRNPPPTHH